MSMSLVLACLLLLLVGCQPSATQRSSGVNPRPTAADTQSAPRRTDPPAETQSDSRRLDPRLLEETGVSASALDVEAGIAYHKTTKYAHRYPAFLRSSTLVHGGYSVSFGTGSNSTMRARHFFDEHGKWMRTDGWKPPY